MSLGGDRGAVAFYTINLTLFCAHSTLGMLTSFYVVLAFVSLCGQHSITMRAWCWALLSACSFKYFTAICFTLHFAVCYWSHGVLALLNKLPTAAQAGWDKHSSAERLGHWAPWRGDQRKRSRRWWSLWPHYVDQMFTAYSSPVAYVEALLSMLVLGDEQL